MPVSQYQDIRIVGTIDEIVRVWEGKGYSYPEGDPMRELCFNHAEHWRKKNDKETNLETRGRRNSKNTLGRREKSTIQTSE